MPEVWQNRGRVLQTMNPSDARIEFQRRRATAWRLAKPWSALMGMAWVTAAAMFMLHDPGEQFRFDFFFVTLAAIGASIVALTFIAYRHYRCPACGAVPRAHAMVGASCSTRRSAPSAVFRSGERHATGCDGTARVFRKCLVGWRNRCWAKAGPTFAGHTALGAQPACSRGANLRTDRTHRHWPTQERAT